jgi:hypothetical protein
MVEAFCNLQRRGLKVRSRALTNTLFARLFVADLFIHGIGGAKYDELTDEVIRRFYGLMPPGYLVLSATLRLPLPTFQATPEHCRQQAARVRDLWYNPQRHLAAKGMGDGKLSELVRQKESWVARAPASARDKKERFDKLRAITAQLREQLGDEPQRLRDALTRCQTEVEANAVLGRRDYPFCLFPEAMLRPFCTQFLTPS